MRREVSTATKVVSDSNTTWSRNPEGDGGRNEVVTSSEQLAPIRYPDHDQRRDPDIRCPTDVDLGARLRERDRRP